MPTLLLLVFIAGSIFILKVVLKKEDWILPKTPFKPEYRLILEERVNFYNALNENDKEKFEFKVHEFLLNHRITGIECDVSITDNLLVAASAIIPVFRFPKWKYSNLYEVFLYPEHFNENHEIKGEARNILGMVGTGYMEGKMILSKIALHHGFDNVTDKKNTAIHEFVHLIDKSDGKIDGVPDVLMENQCSIPWLDLIEQKMEDIYHDKSDINKYGGTSRIEFFAVASEYFFERPKLLAKKHPQLYDILEDMFNHDLKSKDLTRSKLKISKNTLCPCASGKKFKQCCGKTHYSQIPI